MISIEDIQQQKTIEVHAVFLGLLKITKTAWARMTIAVLMMRDAIVNLHHRGDMYWQMINILMRAEVVYVVVAKEKKREIL